MEFYDLFNDVGEVYNVIGEYFNVVKRLEVYVEKVCVELGDWLMGRKGVGVRLVGELVGVGMDWGSMLI